MLNIIPFASTSKGNCYLVENDDTKILLECGVKKEKLQKYLREKKLLITDIDVCLISHSHSDHSESYGWVLDYIDVYSTYSFSNKTNNEIKYLEQKKPYKFGSIKVVPISVEHGSTECYAYVFLDKESCLFFGTDFSLMTQNVSNFKFDKIAIECNYNDNNLEDILKLGDDSLRQKHLRQVSTHMSKDNCIKHLSYMNLEKCKEIILLHPSDFLLKKDEVKKEFENTFKIKTYYARRE